MKAAFTQFILILILSGIAGGGYNLWLQSTSTEKHLVWVNHAYKGSDLLRPAAADSGPAPTSSKTPSAPTGGAAPAPKAPTPADAPVPAPGAGTKAAKAEAPAPAPAPAAAPAAGTPPAAAGEFPLIGLDAATEAYRDETLFLDARRSRDYELGHIPGALPMSAHEGDLLEKIAKLRDEQPLEAPIVIYCTNSKDCEDSKIVGRQLKEVGFLNISIYLGGFPEWEKEKRPVAKGKEPGRREEP